MPTSFEQSVFNSVLKIPKGKVSTYVQVAKTIGKLKACRAVGNALNKSPGMPFCPCHRVVRSNGQIGGFKFGGTKAKIKLLESEGVKIIDGKVDSNYFYTSK